MVQTPMVHPRKQAQRTQFVPLTCDIVMQGNGRNARGEIESGLQIVITVTGHGLKDIDTALSRVGPIHAEVVTADLLAIASVCGLVD